MPREAPWALKGVWDQGGSRDDLAGREVGERESVNRAATIEQ